MPLACGLVTPSGWTIERAARFGGRARGLLGLRGLPPRYGLWIGVRSVHTLGMRFALDLVWLDRGGRVVRVDRAVGPGRMRSCRAANGGVVELAAGQGDALVTALQR